MHVWALGLSCETPAAPPDRAAGARTRQPENSKRAHLRVPALQTPPKFHEKDQKRGIHFSGFVPLPSGPHHDTKNIGEKIGLAKIGLAKIGFGQNWSNQDGQNGIGQSRRRGAQMCTFGVLGLSCASPDRSVWWPRHSKTPTKFNEKTPRERKKNENGSEKKREILGGPGEGRSGGTAVRGKGGPNQTLKPTPTHETHIDAVKQVPTPHRQHTTQHNTPHNKSISIWPISIWPKSVCLETPTAKTPPKQREDPQKEGRENENRDSETDGTSLAIAMALHYFVCGCKSFCGFLVGVARWSGC